MNSVIPFRERISGTIPEACAATGLGRTKIYEEIGAGRVQTRKFGTRTLIVVDSLVALIDHDARNSTASRMLYGTLDACFGNSRTVISVIPGQ
jgi:hypothetical protein